MKKITESRSITLPPLQLYIDDVERIIEIVTDVAEEVEIIAASYELESASELRDLDRKSIRRLEIRTSRPSLSVTFSERTARLYASEETLLSLGVLEKIENICVKRRRKLAEQFTKSFYFYLLPFLPSFLFVSGALLKIALIWWIALITGLIYILWLIIAHRVQFKVYSMIILSKSSEALPFWKRESDEIRKIILTVILTSIFNLFVAYMLYILTRE